MLVNRMPWQRPGVDNEGPDGPKRSCFFSLRVGKLWDSSEHGVIGWAWQFVESTGAPGGGWIELPFPRCAAPPVKRKAQCHFSPTHSADLEFLHWSPLSPGLFPAF